MQRLTMWVRSLISYAALKHTGTRGPSNVDARRKRLLYQSQHRGMKEADLLLGGFAARYLAEMSESELAEFEALLDEADNDLVNWILGRNPVPDRMRAGLLDRIIATVGEDPSA